MPMFSPLSEVLKPSRKECCAKRLARNRRVVEKYKVAAGMVGSDDRSKGTTNNPDEIKKPSAKSTRGPTGARLPVISAGCISEIFKCLKALVAR